MDRIDAKFLLLDEDNIISANGYRQLGKTPICTGGFTRDMVDVSIF
ncbi:hypothetical protein [Varunaivibrio sulfuroxidans]|nr:hypothetical protein [Varunaivibrio sulfuroxidans]WES31257.1 hypothetical protein P3M64_02465 [Varunaivibrio sulfuroxidans]